MENDLTCPTCGTKMHLHGPVDRAEFATWCSRCGTATCDGDTFTPKLVCELKSTAPPDAQRYPSTQAEVHEELKRERQ